ncbi:hypothetical protein [Stutzerimonas stutzeri]|uniref:hypothetical protein n=1 Tax=Stutzerimonas stutzeri TaxID=316 RepID=UPI0036D76721
MSHKTIAVVAATLIEAHELVEYLQQHDGSAGNASSDIINISFTALAWNQEWPDQPFAELHWLCTNEQMPKPAQDITARAAIVHIHYLAGTQPPRYPGSRTYLWRNTDELARFWASFHRAQILHNALGLDWSSYETTKLSGAICQTAAGWGATHVAAVNALLIDALPELYLAASDVVLLIEANHEFSLGDAAALNNLVEDALGIRTADVFLFTEGYQGYGLKLLVLEVV